MMIITSWRPFDGADLGGPLELPGLRYTFTGVNLSLDSVYRWLGSSSKVRGDSQSTLTFCYRSDAQTAA